MAWIRWIIQWFMGAHKNLVVHEVMDTVAEIYKSLPEGCLALAIRLVKHAAESNQLADNAARFNFVFEQLKAHYPDLGTNVLGIVIKGVLASIKKGIV